MLRRFESTLMGSLFERVPTRWAKFNIYTMILTVIPFIIFIIIGMILAIVIDFVHGTTKLFDN